MMNNITCHIGVNKHLDEIKVGTYGGSTFTMTREQVRALSVVIDHFVINGDLFEFANGGKVQPVSLQYENEKRRAEIQRDTERVAGESTARLLRLWLARERVKRYTAEREAASAHLELAQHKLKEYDDAKEGDDL